MQKATETIGNSDAKLDSRISAARTAERVAAQATTDDVVACVNECVRVLDVGAEKTLLEAIARLLWKLLTPRVRGKVDTDKITEVCMKFVDGDGPRFAISRCTRCLGAMVGSGIVSDDSNVEKIVATIVGVVKNTENSNCKRLAASESLVDALGECFADKERVLEVLAEPLQSKQQISKSFRDTLQSLTRKLTPPAGSKRKIDSTTSPKSKSPKKA